MTKIVCFSDNHGEEEPLPDGDILIHAGDASFTGSKSELKRFRKYMESQPHKTKIFVPGNHELTMDIGHENYDRQYQNWLGDEIEVLAYGTSIVSHGLKITGSSMQPKFGRWAFGRTEKELKESYSLISDETNILVTHCPPLNILDCGLGSMALRERLVELSRTGNLRLHVFGHIHEGAGNTMLWGVACANVSILDENYKVKNKPYVIKI